MLYIANQMVTQMGVLCVALSTITCTNLNMIARNGFPRAGLSCALVKTQSIVSNHGGKTSIPSNPACVAQCGSVVSYALGVIL